MTEKKTPPPAPAEDEIEYVDEDPTAREAGLVPGPAPAGPPAPPAPEAEEAPSGSALEALKEKLRRKAAELKDLRKERDDLQDLCLRRLAEMENVRKRAEREKEEHRQYALSELLLELVGVLDNFERALGSETAEADGKTFREGVELIHRMLNGLLLRQGVKPLDPSDARFDPAFHHAMATEESDEVAEPEVAEVLQKGYLLHNRLLRPALVRVRVPRKA